MIKISEIIPNNIMGENVSRNKIGIFSQTKSTLFDMLKIIIKINDIADEKNNANILYL